MSTFRANSNECRVTLEYKDGRVFTGIAIVTTLTIEPIYYMESHFDLELGELRAVSKPQTWSLNLVGIDGAPSFTMPREAYRQQVIEPARTASEWKCERCGAV